MALKCGIVGLPNVGKSTLFNCLSNAKAQAANFPFCTVEPNVGVITVPDERLNVLSRAMINVHSHINGKMPVWQLGLALLESLEAKIQSHRQVVRSGLFQYYDIDYKQLMKMLNVIEILE